MWSLRLVKCKNEISKSLYESICAFLNRNGGDILLGVEDDGTITGVNESGGIYPCGSASFW